MHTDQYRVPNGLFLPSEPITLCTKNFLFLVLRISIILREKHCKKGLLLNPYFYVILCTYDYKAIV